MADNLVRAEDYGLKKLDIIPMYGSGEPVDVAPIMISINLYEDLYSPFMRGNLSLSDATGLLNKLPITGEEFLDFKVLTPGLEEIKQVFRIYRVDNRQVVQDNLTTYTLHFCSKEMIKDAQSRVSFGFKGELLSDMATKVFDEHIAVDKSLEVDPTLLPHRMVSADFTASEFIQRMAKRAQSSAHPSGSDYVFYEDRDAFHFKSIQSLLLDFGIIKDVEDRETIVWQPQNVEGARGGEGTSSMRQFEFENSIDALEKIYDGSLASQLISFDPIQGEVVVTDKLGDAMFGETEHLDANLPFSGMAAAEMMNPNQAFKLIISDKSEEFTNNRDEYLQTQRHQDNMLRNTLINVELPGRTDRKVGDVVDLQMPSFQRPNPGAKALDGLVSSNALITAVHHMFTQNKYVQVVQLAKDAASEAPGSEE